LANFAGMATIMMMMMMITIYLRVELNSQWPITESARTNVISRNKQEKS
jgi:hypothetical protein